MVIFFFFCKCQSFLSSNLLSSDIWYACVFIIVQIDGWFGRGVMVLGWSPFPLFRLVVFFCPFREFVLRLYCMQFSFSAVSFQCTVGVLGFLYKPNLVLKNLGDIHEFIIPSKRDKRGNKYGVVRFFNVRDERMMEARDNFFIEGRKLFSNLPSFRGRNLGRRFGKLKERVKRWRKNLVITWFNPGNQGCSRQVY